MWLDDAGVLMAVQDQNPWLKHIQKKIYEIIFRYEKKRIPQ